MELDPPDEELLNLGSALEEVLNTALSQEGSQWTASPVIPEEESPEGTLSPMSSSPTTILLRGRKNQIKNIPGPASNLFRGLRMERRPTPQEDHIRQMTSKGSSRAMAGPLRRRRT